MKNSRLFIPVALAMLVAFVAVGCGSVAGGGGGGGGTTTYSGKLVDPYIDGATVFVDVNGNGTYDASVTGEMIAVTDSTGTFSFTSSPSLGATIKILVQGIHLGVTYDAGLARYVDGVGGIDMTPMTTLLSYGISADSIVHILRDYAAITVDASAVRSDPMSGLDLSSSSSLANIRGSIAIYCLMKVLEDVGATNETTVLATIEGNPAIQASLSNMGQAIRSGISDNILTNINATIDAISATINTSSGGYSNALPHATAGDVASSAFAITRYVIAQVLDNRPDYTTPVTPEVIEGYARNIGQRFYMNNNKGFVVISYAYSSPIHTMQDAINSGYVVGITSAEVNATTEAFGINGSGNIVPIWQ